MNKEYIDALKEAILHTHGCASRHLETVPVEEVFQGKTVWEGDVEVFGVDHPKAKLCYAWGYTDDNGKKQYVAVLGVYPAKSPQQAVRAYIVSCLDPNRR